MKTVWAVVALGVELGLALMAGACDEYAGAPDWLDPPTPPWQVPTDQPQDDATRQLQLQKFSLAAARSCEDVTAQWREAAVVDMENRLRANYERILNPQPCYQDYGVDGIGYSDASSWGGTDAMGTSEPGSESAEGDAASEYSTTNNQVVGVDEADFLKNDGAFIYILANGQLQILDAWPPEQAHRLSATYIEGEPRALFVHKDVAVVYSALGSHSYDPQPCTYGYECDFTGDGSNLLITVLDIRDKEAPELVREIRFGGSYLASRRIEDIVYTVVYFADPPMPYMPDVPADLEPYLWHCDGDEETLPSTASIDAQFDALHQDNLRQIEDMDVSEWLPQLSDTWYLNGHPQRQASPLAACNGYFLSQTVDGRSLLSLASFDLNALEPLQTSTIIAKPGAVYASSQSLFVAIRHDKSDMDFWFGELGLQSNEATTIHKFVMAPDSPATAYAGSGLVEGRVLNPFAMSEQRGDFRIATTTGHLPDPATHNTLTILQQTDDGLQTVGVLDNIAPGEDIRSVRFGGDTAYVVTFKKTDPLFVIDLADPAHPAIRGELKIPGFSTYMHFIDQTHLLAIGYDADDQGDFAWFQGIALQVFNVSDMANPTLLHREVIGTRGSSSDAATDHLAFNYFGPRELLAIPMVVCEGGDGGEFGTEMTFNGLMVYRVTVDDGFEYLGGVPHRMAEERQEDDYDWYDSYDSACWNWWTDSNSTVKRSIFMEDYVYSVAMDQIKISALDDLAQPLATVDLQ